MTTSDVTDPPVSPAAVTELPVVESSVVESSVVESSVVEGSEIDREAVFRDNVGLAKSMAERYRRSGDHDDFVAVAYAGLWEAVRSWDPSKGPVGPWAARFIRGKLVRHLHTYHPHLSFYEFEFRHIVRLSVERLTQLNGHEPDDVAVADDTGLSLNVVTRIRTADRTRTVPVDVGSEQPGTVTLIAGRDLVVDWADSSDGDVDGMATPPAELPLKALARLDLRDMYVLVRYYGVDGAPSTSLRNIAGHLTESRQQIRSRLQRASAQLHSTWSSN